MFNRKPCKHKASRLTFHEIPGDDTRIDIMIGGKTPHWEVFTVNLNMEEIVDALKNADIRKKLHNSLDDMGDVNDRPLA